MVALPEGDVALGRFEVTVEEWSAFAEAEPDAAEARCTNYLPYRRNWQNTGTVQTKRHPVACVSWNKALAYAGWLSLETGQQYRLPTEAEWDRGAAGGGGGCNPNLWNDIGTCVVGSFSSPSDVGLFDTDDNVAEWTDSCWDGDCSRRVIRYRQRGSWHVERKGGTPDYGGTRLGSVSPGLSLELRGR